MYLSPNDFPLLNASNHHDQSPEDDTYNCIAWALNDNSTWWDPAPGDTYAWPDGLPRELTLEVYVSLFQRFGFARCDNVDLETGFQKVALYAYDDGDFAHVARQLNTGRWTSKLGTWQDIEHATLDVLGGPYYGRVACILRKPIP